MTQRTGIAVKKTFLQRLKKDLKKNKYIYWLAVPMFLYFLIFHYGPMYGLIIAFQDYSPVEGVIGSKFIGFDNFTRFFQSNIFWRLIGNTVLISLKSLILGFPAPLILALLLNEVKHDKLKRIIQTTSYLPHFISLVVICGMMTQFLSRDGFITQALVNLGVIESQNMLTNPKYFQMIYVLSGIWQSAGWGSIIYLAALSGVDESLIEASMIDGANRWKRMLNVTIPSIMPIIIMQFILQLGRILSVGFEKIILLYNPQTYKTADVIATYTYRYSILGAGDYGYSAAIGIFSGVINFALVMTANRISRKVSDTSLW